MKTRYFFLILGIIILIVVAVSWFAFPWRSTTGGLWLLITAAVLGVLSVAKDITALAKEWSTLGKTLSKEPPLAPAPTSKQSQLVEDSHQVSAEQNGNGGIQEQVVKGSTDIHLKQN